MHNKLILMLVFVDISQCQYNQISRVIVILKSYNCSDNFQLRKSRFRIRNTYKFIIYLSR